MRLSHAGLWLKVPPQSTTTWMPSTGLHCCKHTLLNSSPDKGPWLPQWESRPFFRSSRPPLSCSQPCCGGLTTKSPHSPRVLCHKLFYLLTFHSSPVPWLDEFSALPEEWTRQWDYKTNEVFTCWGRRWISLSFPICS